MQHVEDGRNPLPQVAEICYTPLGTIGHDNRQIV